ncbi:helix-turn-helix domain-containing protein [Mycobacterium canetti]|uniref:helix-turn-helix domain-containing protein n=1 Tax=Mycobacterium canetti TaxID=78331 RepID=UPI000346F2B7|nr:helix-turn-helix domain-containing protein [Mycobacterium canetti]
MTAAVPQVVVAVEPELVDKKTTCQMLGGISIDRLEALMRSGELVPRKLGGRVVFRVADVRRFASELASWEPPKRSAS